MRKRWARLKGWQRWTVIGAGILIVIAIIASAAGGGGDDEPAAAETPAQEQPAAKATPDSASDGDTGRMSQGEWEQARDAVFDVNGEIQDYRDQVSGRCATIIRGLEVSAALECIDDAYSGVEDKVGFAVFTLNELKDDVAKQCLRAVNRTYRLGNEDLYQALQASKRALETLESSQIEPAIARLNNADRRWSDAQGDMLQLCSPE